MSNSPTITDAEWQVMHEVWHLQAQHGDAQSREIIDRLVDITDWSDGTVKTLLHRLVQKGILEFRRKGNRYLYRSTLSEQECVDQVCANLLHTVFRGRPISMLHYLVHSSRLSGSEVEALKSELQELQDSMPPVAPRKSTRDKAA